ncbi:Dyp-type peroxidase [Dyadobacter arcticus]|uniref:Dyp-type peroxidase family n=1 Tax=Dyadobacter arcticus TaxID=1078754 RepID=A0ABX0UH53_9BACT|nr:Dyp-type peroxidase [Dyadobacter arcticus]NIJ52343.1 Dyp-type peroxidase family [Dyadobacter arcticus]
MLQVDQFESIPFLDGIQGNILKSHGRHHTANLFIIGDDGKQDLVKAWIHSLVVGTNPIIRSGSEQIHNNLRWKAEKVDSGVFACLHISAAGYKYLFGDQKVEDFEDEAFKLGMAHAPLNDPPADFWEEGLQQPHFMLLLAHASDDKVRALVVEIQKSIMFFTKIASVEKGHAIFNNMGAGIEHFGYVDGISQPLFFDDEWERYRADNEITSDDDIKFDPRANHDLVLVPDPFFQDENAKGSYFVFRKLEQNVKGFKQAEEALAFQIGLEGEDEERAGAMLVGRFEGGTPVQESPTDSMVNQSVFNNFDFTRGDASKCPFHSHIRKTNPRSDLPAGEAAKRRMARRGIPFGHRNDDPDDGMIDNKPEGGVGLLFMSYQASIVNQFQFIQQSWANNPTFPNFNDADPDGLDLIIGQGGPKYPVTWGEPNFRPATFGQFVHMKGGEYFFSPSMRFLREIQEI